MNVDLLEELVRRKVRNLQSSGLERSEAVSVAGNEIMKSIEPGLGCASKFCLRMILEGAKKRIMIEKKSAEVKEGDKIMFRRLLIGSGFRALRG